MRGKHSPGRTSDWHFWNSALYCAPVPMLYRALTFSLIAASLLRAEDFQGSTHTLPFDEEAIFYSDTEAGGPVAELQAKIERGEVQLAFDEQHGYLPAVLDYFGIPKSSQG